MAESEPIGTLERGPLRWVGVRPFLCLRCDIRFLRLAVRSAPGVARTSRDPEAGFLKPAEDLQFQELVERMRDAEREIEKDRHKSDREGARKRA